ncbi:hypothetical protein Ancab_000411 [Ancistrocladus abbreviatus]
MENAGLADKFSGLTVNDPKDNSLIQVMKAVEVAEATIKQQVEENNILRAELHKKDQELEILKMDKSMVQSSHPIFPQGTPLFNHRSSPMNEDAARQFPAEDHSSISRNNGISNSPPPGYMNVGAAGFSQLTSASTAAFSPGRQPMDGEYDPHIKLAGQGLMPVAESNNSINLWKQELVQKVREHEEKIMLLRKQLAEYSIKDAQIRNEKSILEKRIAHMRMAFDQQQQDLLDAASKALSYRQDIIEENVRLTYQLQDAQQERTTFVSFLLPLLAEYSMQPPVLDAQSIVSSVKVLFKYLQEKLLIAEAKLKECQYQLTPWHEGNYPSFAPQSPQHSSGAALSSNKNGLELVPQPVYSAAPVATDAQMTGWDIGGHHARQGGVSGAVAKNVELDDLGRYSPLGRRNAAVPDGSAEASVGQDPLHTPLYHGETINRHVKFKDPVSSSSMDESDGEGRNSEREHPMNRAADDDPLPAIEGLQISGEAYPGRVLEASGYSINGTTCCNFEWVRHLEDGSINYIEGAKQPTYLVTADDVDTCLAIEIQPLDERKRKGELVKMFANDHRKITCDTGMQSHIEKTLYSGHASYTVSLWTSYPDSQEPATLAIKRESYSINCRGPGGVVINEKFLPATTVSISSGDPSVFSIMTSSGVVHLRAEGSLPEISSLRDTIVLTLRFFIIKAGEKKKGKKVRKRGLFRF